MDWPILLTNYTRLETKTRLMFVVLGILSIFVLYYLFHISSGDMEFDMTKNFPHIP